MKMFMIIILTGVLISCNGKDNNTIYNGRVETDIVRISAKTGGTIDSIFFDEGQLVGKGELLAFMDSKKTVLMLKQQKIKREEARINLISIRAQMRQVEVQLGLAVKTLNKTREMVKSGAATRQKQDELETQVQVLQQKINGLKAQNELVHNKQAQLEAGIELTQINISDARVTAPLSGQLLNRFVNPGEFAAPGMPLFEMADLSNLEATIYIPLETLGVVKLGQKVTIRTDGQDKVFSGSVKWISTESEFTPKTILTKETRSTLVYRVKIAVPNPDGILKIGMPVDVEL